MNRSISYYWSSKQHSQMFAAINKTKVLILFTNGLPLLVSLSKDD